MKKILFIFAVLLFTSSIFAEFQKTKVAVIDFQLQGEDGGSDLGKIVAEWLTTNIVKDGRFEVVERVLLRKVIEEQNLAMSGIMDSNNVVEIGKLLGVQVLISGSVVKFDKSYEVNARIIDVKDGSIIVAESIKSPGKNDLSEQVKLMTRRIIAYFPLNGYIVQTDGSSVTIDLGANSGVKEGMKFTVFTEGKTIKHPKTGEVLDVEIIEVAKIKITQVRKKIAIASVLEQTSPLKIEYGQRIKSIIEIDDIKPQKSSQRFSSSKTVTSPKKSYSSSSTKVQSSISSTQNPYLEMLTSEDNTQKVRAAKLIYKKRMLDKETLDTVQNILLEQYNQDTANRHHVEAVAFMCKILGNSQNKDYVPTLKTVSNSATNRKVQKYALSSLRKLQGF